MAPKLVLDQSSARTSAPMLPPTKEDSSLRLLGEVPGLIVFIVSQKADFASLLTSQRMISMREAVHNGNVGGWVNSNLEAHSRDVCPSPASGHDSGRS